jgi:sortase A
MRRRITTSAEPEGRAGPAAGASARGNRRRSGLVLVMAGALLLVGAGVWQGYSWLWSRHVASVGSALVARHHHDIAAGGALAGCAGSSGTGTGGAATGADPVRGVLTVPTIGLKAPVEEGTDDATLAVAVGHIVASVWPGATGTSILAAHDVSYFVHIDQLHTGAAVDYVTPCTTYHFAVSGHQVVKAGSPVYNSSGPTLMLETCWPTDALWFTPDRLLVTATEVGTSPTPGSVGGSVGTTAGSGATPPAVPAPADLVDQGLTLATNSIPMGTLTETGSPPLSWTESPAPLAIESSALQAFIGGLKAAEQGNDGWWHALVPGGPPMPAALRGATVPDWHQGLDVAIATDGSTATGVTLTATVSVSGGVAPGLYALQVGESLHHGTLTVASFTLTPATG